MAQQVKVALVDDLDGGEADQTVLFGLDGKNYEIDLNSANAEKLRTELAAFVNAARKSGSQGRGRRAAARRAAEPGRPSTQEVRGWAKEQGIHVADRGRVPSTVYLKFQEAQAR